MLRRVKIVKKAGFFDNVIKGRIAESIVEELLKKSGFKVFRYGYESVLQNLTQSGIKLKRKDEINKTVRVTPDFLVVKDDYADYIEVKFRSNGIRKEELDTWGDAWLILVIPEEPYIEIVAVDEFLSGESKLIPITEEDEFKVDMETFKKAKYLIKKYLTI